MNLQKMFNDWSAKAADKNAKYLQALMDDTVDTEKIKELKNELKDAKNRRDEINVLLKEEQANNKNNYEPENTTQAAGTQIKGPKNELEKQKEAINAFLHSKGQIKDDAMQVTTTEADPIIPTEIITNPESEVNSVVDLSTLVSKRPVTTGSGSYPVLKRATSTFKTVKELEDNPKLAEPKFEKVNWQVETRRGAIPLSEEAIADSSVDLMGLVGQSINEISVNTKNTDITDKLKGFNAKQSTIDSLVDDIKHILNVDLDPAYNKLIIASQSFFNVLDTLKDKNGQYIFHQDINTQSGGNLLGVKVVQVGDDLLGKSGEMHAFIGDLGRGILFADRQQVSLSWLDSKIYGRYLAAALRYDVEVADDKAGFFLTVDSSSPKTPDK